MTPGFHRLLTTALPSALPLALLLAGSAQAQTAAPAATSAAGNSNVTVYGLIDAATRRSTNSAGGGSAWSMEDGLITGSRFGLRLREDLGDGMAALVTIESGFDPSTGSSLQGSPTADYGQISAASRMWGREVHVGLRGSLGTVTLGRQYTVAHSLAGRFQPLGNPNSTAHSLFSSHHVARQDNLLRVDGKLGGVDLVASYTFGEQAASSSANSAWALGAGYTAGALSLAAYVQQLDNLAGTETRRVLGLGGNYKVGQSVTLYGGLMRRSAEVSPQTNRAWTLGANLQLQPLVTLSLAHYQDDQDGSAALKGSRTVSWVTANYQFSRRTDAYVLVDRNRVVGGYARPSFMATKGTQNGLGFGLRHRF